MITVMWKFVCMLLNLPTDAENYLLYIQTILYEGHASEVDDANFKWFQIRTE